MRTTNARCTSLYHPEHSSLCCRATFRCRLSNLTSSDKVNTGRCSSLSREQKRSSLTWLQALADYPQGGHSTLFRPQSRASTAALFGTPPNEVSIPQTRMFVRKCKASECLTIHRTGLEKIAFPTASVSTRDRSDHEPSSIAVAEPTVRLPPAKFGADGCRSSASNQPTPENGPNRATHQWRHPNHGQATDRPLRTKRTYTRSTYAEPLSR